MKKLFNLSLTIVLLAMAAVSCKKESLIYEGPVLYHFQSTGSSVDVGPATETVLIPIGLTKPADQDITVTVSINEESTAEEGVHYTIESKEVTIKAGEVIGNVVIVPNMESLGVPVTLVLDIVSSSNSAIYNQSYSLKMQQFCEFNVEDFVGTFWFSSPDWWEDEYDIDVVINPDSENSIILIEPYQEPGYNVIVNFDVTDPYNVKASIPNNQKLWYYPSAPYAGDVVNIQTTASVKVCDKTIFYSCSHCIPTAGVCFTGTDEVTVSKVE